MNTAFVHGRALARPWLAACPWVADTYDLP